MDPADPPAGHQPTNLTVQAGAIKLVVSHNTILPREEALGNGLHIPPGEPDETHS